MSKKKSSLINIVSMFGYQFVVMIIGFILPKLLLEQYGPDIHGYTSTVTTIMSYIALLNAGLSAAAIQSLYRPLAQNKHDEISSIVKAIDKFYVKTGIYYTIAVIACALVLPFFITGDITNFEIIFLMIVMGATSTLECFIYSKYMVLLQADQHLYVVSITNTIAVILRTIIQIILIKLNASIILVQALPLSMVFLRMFILHCYVKKRYPYLNKNAKPLDKALSKRWNAFIHQIAGLVVNNTDVVLLSTFKNLTYVSIYSVYNLVFSHLYTFMTSVFSHGTVASFGAIIHEDKKEELDEAFNIYEIAYYFSIIVVYSITSCMILPFVKIYTEKITDIPYVDYKLAILFIIISIMTNLRVPCNTLINASGHFKETQNRAIIEAVINIVASIILMIPFGMYGLLLGTICSFAFRTFDIIIYSNKKILKRKLWVSIKRVIIVVICILINWSIYMYLFKNLNIDNWILWILECIKIGLISVVIATIIMYIFENKTIKLIFRKYLYTRKRGM